MNGAYIAKLMELAEKDSNVYHLLADSGTGYDEIFRRNFPDQIFNFGIGEENMVAAAAGMASVGKIPFVFTAGAFLAYRSMEFIRDDVCFQNLNVKIVGMGSGLSWSSLGPTHHTTEDISVLRAIPNLTILSPATPTQVSACVLYAYEHDGPFYIRIGMNHEKEFFDKDYRLQPEKNDIVTEGQDAVVYVTGSILEEAKLAVDKLADHGIKVKLVNVVTIKPFNEQDVIENAGRYDRFFTVEEHNIHGGLGSIIAETLAYRGCSARICPIGLGDVFAEGYGTHAMVRKRNALDSESIYQRIREELERERVFDR